MVLFRFRFTIVVVQTTAAMQNRLVAKHAYRSRFSDTGGFSDSIKRPLKHESVFDDDGSEAAGASVNKASKMLRQMELETRGNFDFKYTIVLVM